MHTLQQSAYYQICINMLQHSHSDESWRRHVRDKQKLSVVVLQPAAAIGRGGEEKPDVFCLTKVWFTSSTSEEVQISAGCHLRHRHTEEQPPTRLIPSQTKTEVPWSTHVERRSQNMMNQPMQTASSTVFESIAQISTFGPNLWLCPLALHLPSCITVTQALRGLTPTLMKMYGDI